MRKQLVIATLLVCMLSAFAFPATTSAFDLGTLFKDTFKVTGISFLVDKFSIPLNNFINGLMSKHGAGTDDVNFSTKVVPILTVANGGYIGAAQVTGDPDLIDKTQAVLQLEDQFNNDQFRVKALIPVDSKDPFHFSRVQGVGISAIIDVHL